MTQRQTAPHRGGPDLARRAFLTGAAGVAMLPLLGSVTGCGTTPPAAQPTSPATNPMTGRRALGSLQVSEMGLGCQTMPGNLTAQ
jgi:hypothetical protein